MREIKAYIYQEEIEMLKAFINDDFGIDHMPLQWGPELHSLLTSLGNIVTEPGFEEQTWKEMFNKDEKPVPKAENTVACITCNEHHTVSEKIKYPLCPKCIENIRKHSQDLEERMKETGKSKSK